MCYNMNVINSITCNYIFTYQSKFQRLETDFIEYCLRTKMVRNFKDYMSILIKCTCNVYRGAKWQ